MAELQGVNFFAYGTLMFPEVWERVVGTPFVAEPATISGFAVRRVIDDVYPGMIRADLSDRVEGVVIREIDPESLARLDAYESDFYDRLEVTATLEHGERVACQAYVLPERHHASASDEPWDADKFAATSLARYLRRLG